MISELNQAKQALLSGGYTCVLCKEDATHVSNERGVKPLVAWLKSGVDFHGFSAADKVVGKGAAFLYILLGVRNVYAQVISKPALTLLQEHKIRVEYDTKVEYIVNRRGDGFCPFEVAVMEISDPQTSYLAICKKMEELKIYLS